MITIRKAGLALAAALLLAGCSATDALQRVEEVKQQAGKAMLPSIALGECTNLDMPEGEQGSQVDVHPQDRLRPAPRLGGLRGEGLSPRRGVPRRIGGREGSWRLLRG